MKLYRFFERVKINNELTFILDRCEVDSIMYYSCFGYDQWIHYSKISSAIIDCPEYLKKSQSK